VSGYPYDDDVLERVTELLYRALPAMYRVPDEPLTGLASPAGAVTERGDLHRFVGVLAAPLAVLQQSVEELQADLFIDTAHDRIIPYLAAMVGTTLVFPDADSNRRDVRGTVAWRRRKGTPVALEEMGSELTAQPVMLQEGWKRIQLAQDLDIVRPERVAVDLRPAVVAEQGAGPLDALAHTVDVRRISATTGRRHPRHVAHWLFTTLTFPLREATAVDVSVPPDSDVRYAVHPLGGRHPLRARRMAGDTRPFTDRILEQHFGTDPGRWFGQPGGFTIRVCGLPAGIAGPTGADRVPSERSAHPQLGRGDVTVTLLTHRSRGWREGVAIELGLATVNTAGPDAWRPNPATFAARARLEVDARGTISQATTGGPTPGGTRVPMLRLTPLSGGPGCFLPGAHLELASAAAGSATSAVEPALAREGFLRGALNVQLPALQIRGERFLHVAADGTLYDALDDAGVLIDMPSVGSELFLDPNALVSVGPGAAWPPLEPTAEPRMVNRIPAAPGRGPAVMHGAAALRRVPAGFDVVPGGTDCALTFAAQIEHPGGAQFRPFQRLRWTGSDPTSATWAPLDSTGAEVSAADGAAEYAAVARLRDENPARVALAVRFESSDGAATLCPGEVAWTTDDGRTLLVHLPQLDVDAIPADDPWPGGGAAFASPPVRIADDGSTWASDSTAGRRQSLGAIAPIAEATSLRRRRVEGRRLCAWDNEDWTASPPETLELTPAGRLDVDVEHGLFALSADEPPQEWPPGPLGTTPPPSVTTDHGEGSTTHIGALPAAREPALDRLLARPTRLVSRSGTHHPLALADWHDIPRYESLADALAAISARWENLTLDDLSSSLAEVVQFEDSATYPDEAPAWPSGPADAAVAADPRLRLDLTIQAAERERPVVLVRAPLGWSPPAAGTAYASIALLGLALGGVGWLGMELPPSEQVSLELCSVLEVGARLRFSDVPDGARVHITGCETAGLALAGTGSLAIRDSIVDSAGLPDAVDDSGRAIHALEGRAELERVSVGGEVSVRVLEASEVIFAHVVEVQDRFHGCVRFSRVTGDSVLPRVHKVAVDVPVRIVSHNRLDAAWWRLRADADAALQRGAENGSEMGAFSRLQLGARMAGFARRLDEYTPAGLDTGIIRID
jgi:hypothetical protein